MKIGKWILGKRKYGQEQVQPQKGLQPQGQPQSQEQEQPVFDRENQKPVIRSSICTGEQVAGFKDLRTGKFTEIMLIRNNEDMEEFILKYGISRDEISREW